MYVLYDATIEVYALLNYQEFFICVNISNQILCTYNSAKGTAIMAY
jgi:hypothetical protein